MTEGEQPVGSATLADAAAAAPVNKGGRPKGRKDRKKSKARVKEAQRRALDKRVRMICDIAQIENPFQGDSLAFLQATYKNPKLPDAIRLQAARDAAPYENPKLASIEHGGAVGVISHEEALKRLQAGLRYRREQQQATK